MPLPADDLSDAPEGTTLSTWRTGPYNHWSFHNVERLLPVSPIANAPGEATILNEDRQSLESFALTLPGGAAMSLDALLQATMTDAIVILHDGRLVFERYGYGTTATTPHILMSGTKAMVGLIAAILAARGVLDLDEPVAAHVPEIAGTGFDGVTLRQLLDMRAGVLIDREQSAAYDQAAGVTPGQGGLHAFIEGLPPAGRPHGGPFSYISVNTDLAGWVLERATGKPFATLVSETLWAPMGPDAPAGIITDGQGAPWCAGGIAATARDFARVGDLMLNDGMRGDREIIPKAVIDDLRQGGDRQAWKTGEWGQSFSFISPDMSYRNGWYAVHSDPQLLFAMGVHGQNLFIDFEARVVIAKFSSQSARVDPQSLFLIHQAVPALVRAVVGASA